MKKRKISVIPKIPKNLIYLWLTFLIFFLFFLFNFKNIKNGFVNTFLSEYIEDNDAFSLFVGDQKLLESPISGDYLRVAASEDNPANIELPFSQPVSLNGFSLFFPGDLHAVSSYLAEDFDIYFKGDKNDWVLIDSVQGNRASHYTLRMDKNKDVKSFKLVINKAAFDNSIGIGDLKFYVKSPTSFPQGVANFINDHRKGFLSYLGYTFIFYFILLIPGYVLLHLIDNRLKINCHVEDKIAFSPIISVLILAILSLAYIFTEIGQFIEIYVLIFVISLFLFLRLGLYKELKKGIFFLFIIASILLIANLLQAERDFLFNLDYIEKYLDQLKFIPLRGGYYGYHIDNTRSWGIARSFLHHAPVFSEEAKSYRLGESGFSVFDRTPFLSVVTVSILKLFGESHFIYQRFLNVLMALYYGAAYLVVKSFFSKHTAKIVSVLMLLSVHLTYHMLNVEIYLKYFAMYPMFLAFALISEKNSPKMKPNSLIIGLLVALSFFIHPMALIFMAVLFFIYLKRDRISKVFLTKSVATFFPAFVLFCGWAFFSNYMKQKSGLDLSQSRNIYVERLSTFSLSSFLNRLINLINIFIPNILLKGIDKEIGFLRQWIILFLRFSIVSVLTPGIFLAGVLRLKRKHLKKYWQSLWLGIGPIIILLIVLPDYSIGEYALSYQFSLPFLLGFIVEQLNLVSVGKRLLIFVSYPLFMLVPLYYFSGVFIGIRYASLSVGVLFVAIILTYILLSLILLKLVCKIEI